MDFAYGDEQQALRDLAARIFREKASHARLRELERSPGPRFDRALWQALAEAGLLGTAVPEAQGGGGLGFLELSILLEQAGREGFPFEMMETSFFVSRETLIASVRPGMARWRERLFSSMSKNAVKASDFFHVPTNRVIELGTQVEL